MQIEYKKIDSAVPESEFSRLRNICEEILKENPEIDSILNKYYERVKVLFYYKTTPPKHPIPADAESQNKIGTISIYTKHYQEMLQKTADIQDKEAYQRSGLFEEFCHLVEHKGDSRLNLKAFELLSLYDHSLQSFGYQIICKLDTDRNHYEVFNMMLKAYPNDWVMRYSYHYPTPEQYKQQYTFMKMIKPAQMVHMLLVTEYLKMLNISFVTEKAKNMDLSTENKTLLATLLEATKRNLDGKRDLIQNEMGKTALGSIDLLINEDAFQNPEIFFLIVTDLWRNLKFI